MWERKLFGIPDSHAVTRGGNDSGDGQANKCQIDFQVCGAESRVAPCGGKLYYADGRNIYEALMSGKNRKRVLKRHFLSLK